MELKLWIQDHGVYGILIAIARTEEDARKLLSQGFQYLESKAVECYPIEAGLFIENMGDS